ncbi:DUF4062 domain-containing protein [Geothrix terrae]|uniref:DUF4062 domain-containing protein n=1 Tax=Geothrix terrae TaxID=2922720 RepID=UPI001FABA1E0|nr:DUF4062 domain-containing protein [Geothrix terrae]
MAASNTLETIRVFLASPSDVSSERESTPGIINELNRTIAALLPNTKVRLELIRWESHSFPAMGRPQQIINDQIGPYDIFVGILWKRFGTPTGKADSGTEEEFRLAYTNWKNHGKPHILFYFNRASSAPPKTQNEINQLGKIVAFREELESRGLVWEYSDASQFSSALRPHLTEVVGKMLAASKSKTRTKAGKERVPARRTKPKSTPVGAKIRIADIGKRDGFYRDRKDIIGKSATLIEAIPKGSWFMGKVKLDEPAYKGDDMNYPLVEFKFELIEVDA